MKKRKLLALAFLALSAHAAKLPVLNLNDLFTVSGISSGAYMATQMHLSHADKISGVGLIAGGPFGCAEGSLLTALDHCVDKNADKIAVKKLVETATVLSDKGELAALSAMKNHRVWAFHGTADTRVASGVSEAAVAFYGFFISPDKIRYIADKNTAHVFPTTAFGNACTVSAAPFLSACEFDAASELLTFLLPDVAAVEVSQKGQLWRFEQAQYAAGENTLGDVGLVFVPQRCGAGARCDLHIAFHGCQQNFDAIGDVFAVNSGYNEWADRHNVVVLYPQTKSSLMPLNPKGCWDWWGYSGDRFQTKNGAQIRHIMNMVQALRK